MPVFAGLIVGLSLVAFSRVPAGVYPGGRGSWSSGLGTGQRPPYETLPGGPRQAKSLAGSLLLPRPPPRPLRGRLFFRVDRAPRRPVRRRQRRGDPLSGPAPLHRAPRAA